jgi:hypothetical protein
MEAMDCHGPAALAMTMVLPWLLVVPVIAKSEATRQTF